jgi:hypothetical protein
MGYDDDCDWQIKKGDTGRDVGLFYDNTLVFCWMTEKSELGWLDKTYEKYISSNSSNI